jgi:hypothetical protein
VTKLTTTAVWVAAGRPTRIAAAFWLLTLLPPALATAQQIDRRTADSLSAQHILEIAARDSVLTRRGQALVLATELIGADSVGSARTDSLVRGLRDLAITGFDAEQHVAAVTALLASGSRHGQHALLGAVFDSARNAKTRIALIHAAVELPDSLRADLMLRAIQLSGTPSASYVASTAALMALQWIPRGRALLWEAFSNGFIRDARTARVVEAELHGTGQQ